MGLDEQKKKQAVKVSVIIIDSIIILTLLTLF